MKQNPLMIFVAGAIVCAGLLVFVTRDKWQDTETVVETISQPVQTAGGPEPNQSASAQPANEEQQQAAVEPKTEQSSSDEAKPGSTMGPDTPAFDIVRVEEDGMTLVAGTAAPNAKVKLQINGTTVAETKADDRGDWVVTPDKALDRGAHSLTIVASNSQGETQSDQMVTVNVPESGQPLIVLSNPSEPSRVLQKPESPQIASTKQDEPAAAADQQTAATETAAPEKQQAAATEPTAPEEQQAAATEPAAPEQQQAAATEPAAPQDQQAAATEPAAPEEQQPAATEPAAPEEQQAAATEPVASEEQQAAATEPAALEDQQAVATEPVTPEQQQAAATEPAAPEQQQAVATEPAAPKQQQTAATEPAVTGAQQNTESPALGTKEQRATEAQPTQEQKVAVAEPDSKDSAPPQRAAEPAPKIAVPLTLESVDYNDQGDIMFFGRADPGKAVRIYVDNQHVGDAPVDSQGEWMYTGSEQIPVGLHQLRIDQIDANGAVAQRRELPFERADPARVAALQAAQSGAALAKPDAVVETETAARTATRQPSEQETAATGLPATAESSQQPLERATAGAEEMPSSTQATELQGAAEPAQPAEDSQPTKSAQATAPAKSASEAPKSPQVATAETTQPIVAEPEQAQAGVVVIQPGNNLWRISRVIYGRGVEYTTIYEANKDQIRDPHWIYPGQIFTTPGAVPPREINPNWRTPLSELQDETQ